MNELTLYTFIPPVEMEPDDALVSSADGTRAAHYRRTDSAVGGWTLMAQYERIGDVMISVGTL